MTLHDPIAEVSIHCNQAHRAHRVPVAARGPTLRIDSKVKAFVRVYAQVPCPLILCACACPVVAFRAVTVEPSLSDVASCRQEDVLYISCHSHYLAAFATIYGSKIRRVIHSPTSFF